MHAISLAMSLLVFVLFFSCVGTTALFAAALAVGTDVALEAGKAYLNHFNLVQSEDSYPRP